MVRVEQELYKRLADSKGEFDILCIGELLTDYISKEDKPLKEITIFDKFFGGSPANIVFHMSNLEKRPILITKVGDDEDGRFLLKTLEKHNILHEQIKVAKEKKTTKAFIRRHPETPDFEIIRGADTQLRQDEVDFSLIKKAKVIHTNAFTLAEEPTRTTVLKVLEKANKLKKIISFDPNYRLKVWKDKEQALKILKKVYSLVDLTKPSIDDAKELFGAMQPEQYIKRFHELGAKIVVLTMGGNGSIISTGKKTLRIPPEQCEGKEATGAGDVYWAVFLTALIDGNRLEKAGRKASYAASKAVKNKGAILNRNDYDEILAYMRLF